MTVRLLNNGSEYRIPSDCTAQAYYIRADGAYLTQTASINADRTSVYVNIKKDALIVSGKFSIVLKLIDANGATTSIFAGQSTVISTTTDRPADVNLPTIDDLLEQLTAMENASAACNNAATSANSASESANAAASIANNAASSASIAREECIDATSSALSAANDLRENAERYCRTWVSAEAPSSGMRKGDLWFSGAAMKSWSTLSAEKWSAQASKTWGSYTALTNAVLHVYDGSTWIVM